MAFTLEIKHTPSEFVKKVKEAVEANNGEFSGDDYSGKIKLNTPVGKIESSYKINENKLTVDITKKPFFLSENMIKNELEKYL